MLLNVRQDIFLGLTRIVGILQTVVYICSVRFEGSSNVDRLLQKWREARVDRSTIHHQRRTVMSSKAHDHARHILVAAGNGNAGV